MSSELTIDIQLTELGFSSWGFQLLKQKETPQGGSASVPEDAAPSTSPSVENHVGDEANISPVNFSINQDSQISAEEVQADPSAGKKVPGHKRQRETDDSDDEEDKQIKNYGIQKMCEEQKGVRRTNGNWEIDVAVYDDDEEDDEDEEEYNSTDDDREFPSDRTGLEEHRCHVCDLTFSNTFLLREHLHIHTGVRPYCCSECGKQFCHLANYQAHLRSHATFSCLICTAKFASQELLQDHLDTNHFEKEFYQCDFCKRIFVSLSECKEHVRAHKQEVKRYPCPKCDRSFHHQTSLHRHLKWHKKSALICTDCGQAFPKKISLLRHSFSHLGLLPYTCVHCRRHFRLASLYRKHECRPEHIQCVACLVVFQSQDDFEKHKKDTGCWGHQISSPAKTDDIRCMECGQTFGSSEELKRHAGTHQRVMKCSECGMGFRSSLMLMSHMGGHAAKRPCLCKECGLGFPHQHAYDSHLKTCGMVSPPEPPKKKPKPPSASKKKEIIIAPKTRVLQTAPPEPENQVSQSVLLRSLSPAGNQTKPPEGPWTLVMNKEQPPGNMPYVMFLPTPIMSPTEGIQNSKNLVSPSTVSEKHVLLSHATDVPLPSTKQGPLASVSQVAKSDRPVLLQGVANPSANVLIPLTVNSNSPKIRWTVLEGQHTPGSVTNMCTMTKNKTVVALVESKQAISMSQVHAEDKQKGKVLSNLEISKTLQKNGLIETKPNLPSSPTVVTHNPETPLCLVKFKTEPDGHCPQRSPSKPDGSNSSVESAEVRSSVLSTKKNDSNVLGTSRISGPSESTTDKKEVVPSEEHERIKNLIPPLDSDVDEDVCQCEICGIVLLEKNIADHIKEHSVVLGSACRSPPPGPPCKRLSPA